MNRARRIVLFGCLAAAVFGLSGAACIIEIDPPGGGGGGGGGDGPSTIRVRVINASNTTLDPEIFFSDREVSLDQLFVGGNKFTRFGVGTLGLLGPTSEDSFNIECASFVLLGTTGGAFGDDLNNPIGVGQPVVLQKDRSVFCGATVTLTYRRSGNSFTTEFSVDR